MNPYGQAGNDVLEARRGNDILRGGDGDDILVGEQGKDSLYGDAGDDLIDGGLNSDRLRGGDGADQLLGGAAADALTGGRGLDELTGGTGDDKIYEGHKKAAAVLGPQQLDALIFDEPGEYSQAPLSELSLSDLPGSGGERRGVIAGLDSLAARFESTMLRGAAAETFKTTGSMPSSPLENLTFGDVDGGLSFDLSPINGGEGEGEGDDPGEGEYGDDGHDHVWLEAANESSEIPLDEENVIEPVSVSAFKVKRTGDTSDELPFTVTFSGGTATYGQDYTIANSGYVYSGLFEFNQDTYTIYLDNIPVDDQHEGGETIIATLAVSSLGYANPQSPPSTDPDHEAGKAYARIFDSEQLVMSVDSSTVLEGEDAIFTISLDYAYRQDLEVVYSVTNGTATLNEDYTSDYTTVTIPAGETSVTVHIPTIQDTNSEEDENFYLTITSPLPSLISVEFGNVGTGTITNDDTTFWIEPASIDENEEFDGVTLREAEAGIDVPAFVIRREFAGPARTVYLSYAGVAEAGNTDAGDYLGNSENSQILTSVEFPEGETSFTIYLQARDDEDFEGGWGTYEEFTITLEAGSDYSVGYPGGITQETDPDGDAGTAKARVEDNEKYGYSIDDVEVDEGDIAYFTITLDRTADEDITFYYATGSGSADAGLDFTEVVDSVVIPAGGSYVQVAIQTLSDEFEEEAETFTVAINSTSSPEKTAPIKSNGTGEIAKNVALKFINETVQDYSYGSDTQPIMVGYDLKKGSVVFATKVQKNEEEKVIYGLGNVTVDGQINNENLFEINKNGELIMKKDIVLAQNDHYVIQVKVRGNPNDDSNYDDEPNPSRNDMTEIWITLKESVGIKGDTQAVEFGNDKIELKFQRFYHGSLANTQDLTVYYELIFDTPADGNAKTEDFNSTDLGALESPGIQDRIVDGVLTRTHKITIPAGSKESGPITLRAVQDQDLEGREIASIKVIPPPTGTPYVIVAGYAADTKKDSLDARKKVDLVIFDRVVLFAWEYNNNPRLGCNAK